MNKFRKTLIGFLSASCLVCMGAFMAACTENETPPEPAATYTITLDYNAEQGTVTKSPDLAKYEKDDVVTISVSANDGYEVDVFTVSSDAEAVLNEVGNYTLTVTEDTTVSVTFKEVEVPPTGTYVVTLEYDAEQGSVTLNPAKEAYIGGEEVTVTVLANDGYAVDTFTVSTDAEAALNEVGNYTLTVWEPTTVTVTFKAEEVTPTEKFPAEMQGTWNGFGADGYVVTITEDNLTVVNSSGETVEATFTVSTLTGDFGETATFATVTMDGVTYELVLMGGDKLLALTDYENDETLLYLKEGTAEVTLDESLYGTWVDEEGVYEESLVISEEGVLWGDTALTAIHAYEEDGALIAYLISDESAFMILYTEGYFYFFDIVTYEPYAMLVKAEEGGDVAIPAWLLGTSYLNVDGMGVLTISEKGAIGWLGYDLTVVEFEDTSDMFSHSFTATVSIEDAVYALAGNANSFTATNNSDGIETVFTFVALAETVNSAFRGTWTIAGGEVVFEINSTTVTYNGMLEITTFAYDGNVLYVDSGMGVWELALYANNADVLLVTINSYGYSMKAAYVKQGAQVGVSGIDWAGLVGTWETADGEILTINQDGSATWAGHTVIVLSSSEKLINGKQDFMTLIVDYDLVETVVDIVDNVPGEMKITLESEGKTYTFTKTSNSGGGEEGGFSFANTVWTNGVWKFSFDGTSGIDVYQNGNYYRWISDLTLNGTSFRAVYLDDDGMEAQITGKLSEDGNSITVNWIDQGLFGAIFTKEGAGSEPSDNPFAGTWYANWDGWVLTIVDEDDVTLTNGSVTYTGTYFYIAIFGTIEFSFNDEEGVIGAYSFTCDVNGDFSSFAVSLRSGIEIEIGTTFSKTPSSGGPEVEPDPDAKFAEEHLGVWTFVSEDDGYELPDLILYKDGSLTWGDLTGWLYFVEDYADDWGFINYTVYLYDYADFYVLQYNVEGKTMNLWLGAGMDYYFTKGEGGGEEGDYTFADELLGTWVSEDGITTLVLNADGTAYWGDLTGKLTEVLDYGEFGVFYTLVFGDVKYMIAFYSEAPDSFDLTNMETYDYVTFTREGSVPANPLADYVGTWNVVVEAGVLSAFDKLVITEDGIAVYLDTALQTSSYTIDEWGIIILKITLGSDTFTYELNLETEYLVALYDASFNALYFTKEGMPALSVSPDLSGTWVSEYSNDKLVISVDGSVSFGPDNGLVVGGYADGGYYMYRVLFGTQLGVISVSGWGTEYMYFELTIGDSTYVMSLEVKQAVYIPEGYRNATWTGSNHTVTVDEDGNVYINEVLCELLSVEDWGYPYCTVAWNGATWTLEIYGDEAALHLGYDWYELVKEGASGITVPAALLGTTWTGTGNNEFATRTWGKSVTITIALDGTITITIGSDTYTATINGISVADEWGNSDALFLLVNGEYYVDWYFYGGFDGTSFESSGDGFAFDATKNA